MNTENDAAGSKPEPPAQPTADIPVYTYETGGISEHRGHIPFWLWLTALFLVIWGVYYLITNWNAPA